MASQTVSYEDLQDIFARQRAKTSKENDAFTELFEKELRHFENSSPTNALAGNEALRSKFVRDKNISLPEENISEADVIAAIRKRSPGPVSLLSSGDRFQRSYLDKAESRQPPDIKSSIDAENEWEHRRFASVSKMHSHFYVVTNTLQDQIRNVVDASHEMNRLLKQARDLISHAGSMAKKCSALKSDQPHEITKRLHTMLRRQHEQLLGAAARRHILSGQGGVIHPHNESGERLYMELRQSKDQLSRSLEMLEMTRDQRDSLAKDNDKLRAELARFYALEQKTECRRGKRQTASCGIETTGIKKHVHRRRKPPSLPGKSSAQRNSERIISSQKSTSSPNRLAKPVDWW